MDVGLQNLLQESAHAFGVSFNDKHIQKFSKYLKLLLEWNQKINLTAICEPEQIVTHHFIDSLAVAAYVPAQPDASLVDVGSGAGFPGVVCALVKPWQVTLVERIAKKSAFLLTLRRELNLTFQVVTADMNALNKTFDIAVSRATFSPPEWVQKGTNLVAPNGYLIAMENQNTHSIETPIGFASMPSLEYHVGKSMHRLKGWQRNDSFSI